MERVHMEMGNRARQEQQVKEETLIINSTCLKRKRPSYWGCNKSTSHVKSNATGRAGLCAGDEAAVPLGWLIHTRLSEL